MEMLFGFLLLLPGDMTLTSMMYLLMTTAAVRKAVADMGDELVTAAWGKKVGKGEDRLLIIGKYRIQTIKKGLGGRFVVMRNFHLYDLQKLSSQGSAELRFTFPDYVLSMTFPGLQTDDLITPIRQNLKAISQNFPSDRPVMDMAAGRLVKIPAPEGLGGGVIETYLAYANYFQKRPSTDVINHLRDTVEGGSRDFDLTGVRGLSMGSGSAEWDVTPLIAALKHNNYFTSFMIRDAVRKDVVFSLGAVLGTNSTITKIVIDNCSVSDGFAAFGAAIGSNPKLPLAELDVSNNPKMKDKGIVAIAKALTKMGPTLRKLRLRNCGMSGRGLEALMLVLHKNEDLALKIEELDVSWNNLGKEGTIALGEWISKAVHWDEIAFKSLNVSGTKLDPTDFLASLRNFKALHTLDISHNKFDSNHTEALVGYVGSATHLTELSLAGTKLNPAALSQVVVAWFSNARIGSHNLDLSNSALGPAGCKTVCEALNKGSKTLETLIMNDNKLGSAGLIELFGALLVIPGLKEVHISRNIPKGAKDTAKGVTELVKFIDASRVQTVHVAGDDDRFYLGDKIQPLLAAVARCQTLRELDVSGNRFADEGANVIAESLKKNKSLTALSMDGNRVTHSGYGALAAAFSVNKTLLYISVPQRDLARLGSKKDSGSEAFRVAYSSIATHLAKLRAENPEAPKPSKYLERATGFVMGSRASMNMGSGNSSGSARRSSRSSKSGSRLSVRSVGAPRVPVAPRLSGGAGMLDTPPNSPPPPAGARKSTDYQLTPIVKHAIKGGPLPTVVAPVPPEEEDDDIEAVYGYNPYAEDGADDEVRKKEKKRLTVELQNDALSVLYNMDTSTGLELNVLTGGGPQNGDDSD